MKARLQHVNDHGIEYDVLVFCCPGCAENDGNDGFHMIPVNTSVHSPSWDWDGNLEAPTLSPSILTRGVGRAVCHSFLKAGVFQFLTDSTHSLAGRNVEMPTLPVWAQRDHG